MSEKVKKNVEENEETVEEPRKKPAVAKATVKKEKKPNIFVRGWRWVKGNWKPLAVGAGVGAAASVGTAAGVGYLQSKKRKASMTDETLD